MSPQSVIRDFGLTPASDSLRWLIAADAIEELGRGDAAAAIRSDLIIHGFDPYPVAERLGHGSGSGEGLGNDLAEGYGEGDGNGCGFGDGNSDGYGGGVNNGKFDYRNKGNGSGNGEGIGSLHRGIDV